MTNDGTEKYLRGVSDVTGAVFVSVDDLIEWLFGSNGDTVRIFEIQQHLVRFRNQHIAERERLFRETADEGPQDAV